MGALLVAGFPGPSSLAAPAESAVREARAALAEGRQAAAIATLRDQLERRPGDREARVLLARLLSWSGALVEAGRQAERVLAEDPDHREALRVKADAATWRGDFATALPGYRRYLRHEPSADARLAYANALVSADYRERATAVVGEVDETVAERDDLVRRLQRARAPSLLVGGTRYRDSDGSRRNESRAALEYPLGDVRLSALFEAVEADSARQGSDAYRALLGGEGRLTDWLEASVALGATTVRDDATDEYPVGRLSGWGRRGDLGYRLRLERDVFDETATLLANRIRRSELELGSSYAFSDRLRLDGLVTRTHYSDDNDAIEAELTPQLVLRLGDPGVRLGYRRTHLTFDRQSGGGYFDPDRLEADRLMLFATLYRPRVRGDAELFVGHQEFSRSGDTQDQFIAGGSARLDIDLSQRLTLRTEVEGGNFDLRTPNGFSYWLATVNLVVRL